MQQDMQPSPYQLLQISDFLDKVSDTNEDTRYDTEQDPLVQTIIDICISEKKTSIVEDFEKAYVHPMITIQKWSEELKEIVNGLINQTPTNS
jgi:hypothetical protein